MNLFAITSDSSLLEIISNYIVNLGVFIIRYLCLKLETPVNAHFVIIYW